MEKGTKVVADTLEHTDGQGTRRNLHGRARHVDGGTEGHGEARNVLVDAVLHGLPQRHGDGGGRRRGAQRRHIGRQHVPQQPEGVLSLQQAGKAELIDQDEDVERKDDGDDLGEDGDDAHGLARDGHVEENAEDIERQQGDDEPRNDPRHHVAELRGAALQRGQRAVGDAQAEHERQHQGRHDVDHGRYLDLEERLDGVGLGRHPRHVLYVVHHAGEEQRARAVGQQTTHHRVGIGHGHRGKQHLACTVADIADGRRHQSYNNKRYEEAQQLAEDAVEGHEQLHARHGHEVRQQDTEHDGHDDARQQSEVFHKLM